MYKSTIALSVIALAAFGSQKQQESTRPEARLKEEEMRIEYTVTSGEAVLLIEAESEDGLGRVEVCNPAGEPMMRIWSRDQQDLSLQGFVIETKETAATPLFERYQEGSYELRARTVDGREARGSATLSHVLPATPEVIYPFEGATQVPTTVTVCWVTDPSAEGYRVGMEQNENDGLIVELPAGTSQFTIPPGVLEPGTESQLEIGAIGSNGNCTLVEVVFTTM